MKSVPEIETAPVETLEQREDIQELKEQWELSVATAEQEVGK